jgi:hypothetical protein
MHASDKCVGVGPVQAILGPGVGFDGRKSGLVRRNPGTQRVKNGTLSGPMTKSTVSRDPSELVLRFL